MDEITSIENSEKAYIEKYDEATQNRSKELEASKTLIGNEVNKNQQQPQMTKNEIKKQSVAKGSYTSEYELNKGRSCQRRFSPPMISITCLSCHKPRHIAEYCKTKKIQSNQQKMFPIRGIPQGSRWKGKAFAGYTN